MGVSSTATSSDAAELDTLEQKIKADAPEPPPPAEEPPAPAAAAPAKDPADQAAELLDTVGEHPEILDTLTEADVQDLLELLFGVVADGRGKHWEMPAESPEAKRIAKWVNRSVQRHGWAWLAKWMPDVLAVALFSNAIAKRVRLDREAAHQAPAAA